MSYGGLLFDLGIVPFVLWRRTRVPAFICALAFHVMNSLLFNIGIFPWFMIAATTLFFEPDWPSRTFAKLKTPEPGKARFTGGWPQEERARRVWTAVLCVWALFHVTFPFRHLLYAGDVHWTDEGHRFAWQMKSRSKPGEAVFFARDPVSGHQWRVDHRRYLNPRQYVKMVGRPELIRQFARYLSDQLSSPGRRIEIRADVWVSLNGRVPKRILDPDVDLAALPDSPFAPTDWVYR